MIDVENKEGCRQAAVSKDTEGMNRREGLAGSACLGRGHAPGPRCIPTSKRCWEMKLRGRQGPGQGWTRASTSAFQQGSLETHHDHHAHS